MKWNLISAYCKIQKVLNTTFHNSIFLKEFLGSIIKVTNMLDIIQNYKWNFIANKKNHKINFLSLKSNKE